MTKGVIGADVRPLFDLFLSSILSEFVISDLRPVVHDPTVLAGSGNTGTVIRHQPSLSHFSVSYCPVPCMYPPIHDCILYSIYFYLYKFIIFVTFLLCSFLFIRTIFMSCMCMCRHIYFHTMFRSVFFVIQSHTIPYYVHILPYYVSYYVYAVYVYVQTYIFSYYVPLCFSLFIQSHTMFIYSHIMLPCSYIVCALYVISTLCSTLYSFLHTLCVYI